MTSIQKKMLVFGVIGVVLLILSLIMIKVATVHGNEIGVLETWSGGVEKEPLQPKTYVFFPGFTQTVYTYPKELQIFVMNDVTEAQGEQAQGRPKDSYLVQSAEGQDMHVSLNVQWRIDTAKVVEIHQTVRTNIVENLLRPVVMRVVKDAATKYQAINAYSGAGLVTLQNEISVALTDPKGELRERGIIVENFVIEHIRLDAKYISEITEKQVAQQRKLKEDQMTIAANATALRVEAEAQADAKKQVVAAERDKMVGILKAEQDAKVAVLGATAAAERTIKESEAQKARLVLEATGARDAALLKAEGIIALGKAEAEAKKLALSAYAVPGSESFVRIEIAKAMADGTRNIQGYLPQGMSVMTLGNNFMNAVEAISGKQAAPAK